MLVEKEQRQLEEIRKYVEAILLDDATGHGMDHIQRVVSQAEKIAAEEEQAVLFIVKAGAYLHDVIDDKLIENEETAIFDLISFLQTINISSVEINQIIEIITNVSYSKEYLNGRKTDLSIEAKIVQDADRLDALGAIGILRTAYYGGAKGHKIHDPELAVKSLSSKESYRNGSTVINHFYEKLLNIQEGLHTSYAKKIGKQRHEFLLNFLDEFYLEWES